MGRNGNSERLYFGGTKITADGSFSHEIKIHFLLERKAMTNLDSILKSRDITLPEKVHLVKATIFPIVMYGCESWTIKKAGHRRMNAFELGSWESPGLQGDQTSQSSRKSVLHIHWKNWHWSWSSNTLATWCEELTHLKRPWWRLKAGPAGDNRGWDGWMASPTWWTWSWTSSGSWWWTVKLACCSPWSCKESDMTEWLNWTELNMKFKIIT